MRIIMNAAVEDPAVGLESLSRWDDDGGRELGTSPEYCSDRPRIDEPALTDAELVTMRVRLIALENLVIALLVNASESQLGLATEMASYISPRDGFTQHPLTIRAAAHMKDLVQRAGAFRTGAWS